MAMTTNAEPIRHGDVTLWPIAAIDDEQIGALTPFPKSPAGYVLTTGSATGHDHVIVGSGVAVYSEADSRVIVVREPAQLVHAGANARHEPIALAPGYYRQSVKRQHAIDGSWQPVQD